jgi:aminoacrylate hydrolase
MTLAYNLDGASPQAVLLVTGLGGHAEFWNSLRQALSPSYTVISFDQRGCGANKDVAGQHTLAEIAQDAIEILDDAGFAKVSLVGHSMGGVIAQCLVLDHPHRFNAVVFSGTFCAFDWYMTMVGDLRNQVLSEAGPEAYGKLSALLAMPGGNVLDADYDLQSRVNRPARVPSPVVQARQNAPYGFDRRSELGSVTIPSLVVGAADDMLAPLYQSKEIASLIPGSQLEVMDGGHFFPVTRSRLYAEKLGNFLGNVRR